MHSFPPTGDPVNGGRWCAEAEAARAPAEGDRAGGGPVQAEGGAEEGRGRVGQEDCEVEQKKQKICKIELLGIFCFFCQVVSGQEEAGRGYFTQREL